VTISLKRRLKKLKKALMDIPERDYLACFEDWKKRILSGGVYFKGDKIDLVE